MADDPSGKANLIAKLETASEGNRELNMAVWLALHPDHEVGSNDLTLAAEKIMPPFRFFAVPPLTTSLDGAISLVPEGWIWDVTSTGTAWVMEDCGDQKVARAKTPALALCICALLAREAPNAG